MKPPLSKKTDFERIKKTDEWIEGVISDIEYDNEHKKTFNGETKVGPAVRFKFTLKDHDFPKRSRWISFSYNEKSNLYKKFVCELVEDAEPDFDFDLDDLKGFEVKTMWKKDGEYDNLELIRPLGQKFNPAYPTAPVKTATPREAMQAKNPKVDEEVEF